MVKPKRSSVSNEKWYGFWFKESNTYYGLPISKLTVSIDNYTLIVTI